MGHVDPIVAIFGMMFGFFTIAGIGSAIVKFMEQKVKLLQNQTTQQAGALTDIQAEVSKLKEEIAQLRNTTTQYDLSVDRALHETQHRLATLETRARGEYKPAQPAAAEDSATLQPRS